MTSPPTGSISAGKDFRFWQRFPNLLQLDSANESTVALAFGLTCAGDSVPGIRLLEPSHDAGSTQVAKLEALSATTWPTVFCAGSVPKSNA